MAKELITEKGYTFEETNLNTNPILRGLAISSGFATVPQIWVANLSTLKHIGGYEDLQAYFNKGN